MQYHIDSVDPSKGPTYERVKKFGQILLDNCAYLWMPVKPQLM